MSIIAYMVSFFFVQFYLGPKNVATAQATLVESLDSSTEIANSIEEDEGYFIQDRTVERLHALHHFVDDRISKLLSMDQNLPFVKLLKGICPEMLVQEPVKGLKFQCHALKTNDCFCFSHKKASNLVQSCGFLSPVCDDIGISISRQSRSCAMGQKQSI
ncbi:uncharacterized protein LOC130688681 isoform X2 [Daphnia carinata]|uniref:uncharacterized protein LOC130688681 isoform X2 n=1 Tax=Daphnia carinata TaxID=120202 RepID=UPI002868631D|nr:uncharacterized protein LOC130688681 isoform X2 [Daphnia carinata]